MSLGLRVGRLHPAKQRLVAYGLALLVAKGLTLLAAVLAFGGTVPEERVVGRTTVSAAESWENLATILIVTASLDLLAFLMVVRSRRHTALGLALIALFSTFVSLFLLSALGVLWEEDFALSFAARRAQRAAIVLAALAAAGLSVVSADPERVPPGRVIATRVTLWTLGLFALALTIVAISRWR